MALEIPSQLSVKRIFTREGEDYGTFQVIKWWEVRRIPYNIVVGATGITAILWFLFVAWLWPGPPSEAPELPDPPVFFVFIVFGYGIGANICYTGGWICELVLRKFWSVRGHRFSEIALKLGLSFSILLTLAPALFFTLLLGIRRIFE